MLGSEDRSAAEFQVTIEKLGKALQKEKVDACVDAELDANELAADDEELEQLLGDAKLEDPSILSWSDTRIDFCEQRSILVCNGEHAYTTPSD